MRSLFDVNFLIALLDEDHTFHRTALDWFTENSNGWASCPLSQNAFVRITSNPKYTGINKFSVKESIKQFNGLTEKSDHEFWRDDISILDSSDFDQNRIHGPGQITDIYLLALATKRKGCLVTFDTNIPLSAVHGANSANLHVL